MKPMERLAIAGIGNILRQDDGVGVRVLEHLRREPIPGVRWVEVGTAVLHGVACLESAHRVLLLDAARGNQPPGTVYFVDLEEPAAEPPSLSLHALGLREAFRRLLPGYAAPRFALLGIEPEQCGYGLDLSRTLRARLPEVVGVARALVRSWVASAEAPLALNSWGHHPSVHF